MARSITADLRRESIDLLGVGGSYTEKLSASSNSCDGETVPLRRLGQADQDLKKQGEFMTQNGHKTKDDKRGGFKADRIWGLRPEEYRRIQNYCFRFLEMPRGFFETSYHALLFFLVIASLVLTVLSTVHTEDKNYEEILQTPVIVVEIILIIVFLIEYVVRLWSAGCRSAYVGVKGRLRFAVQLYSIIDLIVLVSSIVAVSLAGSNISSSPIRLLRFLPLLRVLRFDRQAGTWKLLGSVIYVHRRELLTTFYLGFISLIFASFVLYMVEKDANIDLESWPSSVWWGIVTLTTVGYGDTVPVTWYGKCCAALFALCGISFFALPAGILGSGFALKVTQQQRQKHFNRRRRPAAILLQSYWRLLCSDIDSKSIATWLPSIYYNRQQHLLKAVMEKTGTTGTTQEDDGLSDSQRKRKRSIWSKQKGLRRGSYDVVQSSRSDSQLTGISDRKPSTCSALEHEFLDENALLALQQDGERPCIALTNAQKLAIRLIRILKLRVAIRKFKEARRPYDVKDVIEQYSAGHVEMLARVKNLQTKMDKVVTHTTEGGDEENAGKQGINKRLTRVEHQVSVIDSKLELVLQMLQNMQTTRGSPSGGSHSYDLHFRGNGDGVSSRRSSVSRAHSDPLDVRTQMSPDPRGFTTHVVRPSDIPCVTLSDPESFQSSRPVSLSSVHSQSLHGSVSGGDQNQNTDHIDGVYLCETGALNAPVSRNLVTDKRQLSDVTEESLGDSKENVLGGLTPPGPISQQNSTASETESGPGGADSSLPEKREEEPVWEKREMDSLSRRRKRSLLSLGETESKLPDDEEAWDTRNPSNTDQGNDLERNISERYTGTPERRDSLSEERSTLPRGAHVVSVDDPPSRVVEEGHYDSSVRSAPTRMSAKRRPLVKSNPVEV